MSFIRWSQLLRLGVSWQLVPHATCNNTKSSIADMLSQLGKAEVTVPHRSKSWPWRDVRSDIVTTAVICQSQLTTESVKSVKPISVRLCDQLWQIFPTSQCRIPTISKTDCERIVNFSNWLLRQCMEWWYERAASRADKPLYQTAKSVTKMAHNITEQCTIEMQQKNMNNLCLIFITTPRVMLLISSCPNNVSK